MGEQGDEEEAEAEGYGEEDGARESMRPDIDTVLQGRGR